MHSDQLYTVSVSKAINYGIYLILIPTLLLFTGIPFLVYLLKLNYWIVGMSFVISMFVSYIYWLFTVNKWKIWVLNNVRNIHELYEKAIERKIINKPNSFFSKTEFAITKEQKHQLEELENIRFSEADFIADDVTVPNETEVYYSKFGLIIFSILSIVFAYLLLFGSETDKKDTIKIKVFFPISLLFLIRYAIKYLKIYPVFTMSNEGIKIENSELFSWNEVTVNVGTLSTLSDTVYVKICYLNPIKDSYEFVEIEVDDLKISRNKLEHYLNVYQHRYKMKYNNE